MESSTGIQLKTLPRWLISEERLREQQETGNKRGSAIVITVKGETEAKKLCASGLRFGGVIKVVEKYWEAGPSSVCMACCGIGHERMGSCGNRPARCIICTGPHKVEEHQCGVIGCTKGRGKVCVHVTVKCANCGGGHMANSPRCASRHKAGVKANKERKLKKHSKKGKERAVSEDGKSVAERDRNLERETESSEVSPNLDMGMDLAPEWAEFEEGAGSDHDEIPEGIDYTKDCYMNVLLLRLRLV